MDIEGLRYRDESGGHLQFPLYRRFILSCVKKCQVHDSIDIVFSLVYNDSRPLYIDAHAISLKNL